MYLVFQSKFLKFSVFAAAIILASSNLAIAGSNCTAPAVPNFSEIKPALPAAPDCIDEVTKAHNCAETVVLQYNSEVETYNSRIKSYYSDVDRYIIELNAYLKSAREYAQCEVDRL